MNYQIVFIVIACGILIADAQINDHYISPYTATNNPYALSAVLNPPTCVTDITIQGFDQHCTRNDRCNDGPGHGLREADIECLHGTYCSTVGFGCVCDSGTYSSRSCGKTNGGPLEYLNSKSGHCVHFDYTNPLGPGGGRCSCDPYLPGATCTSDDTRWLYCRARGRADVCPCDINKSGYGCDQECNVHYCSFHQVGGACKQSLLQNTCSACSAGWGPQQDDTNYLERDPFYAQVWCSVPFGVDRLNPSGPIQECNGVGFAVDVAIVLSIFGLPSSFQLLASDPTSDVPHFNTHPLYIQQSLDVRYPSGPHMITPTNMSFTTPIQTYTSYYNSLQPTTCLSCDPGYSPHGAQCVASTCKAWTSCHATDAACIEFNRSPYPTSGSVYVTSQLCAGTMYDGSTVPRGHCRNDPNNPLVFDCLCENGYGGLGCEIVMCSWSNGLSCSGNGMCNNASNRCICNDGWVGMACELASSESTCNTYGQTTDTGSVQHTSSMMIYEEKLTRTARY